MSVLTPTMPQTAAVPAITAPPAAEMMRADVVIEDRLTIPGWISTLNDYLRWAYSDSYPQSGWISYLDGKIWVDLNMEEFLSHNQVKHAFDGMFYVLFKEHRIGRFVPDRMLLVNEAANLSTEPDGLFYLWDTMQSGRLRLVPGKKVGYMQLEGTPDGVLEIVSDSSVTKDVQQLRELYWKAQIPEYWLVDARGDTIRFEILRRAEKDFEPTPAEEGWLRSGTLGRSFRIERTIDPLGMAEFVVHVKS